MTQSLLSKHKIYLEEVEYDPGRRLVRSIVKRGAKAGAKTGSKIERWKSACAQRILGHKPGETPGDQPKGTSRKVGKG